MESFNNKLTVFLLCLLISLIPRYIYGQQLLLKIAGDDQDGYRVDIYNNYQLLVTSTEEFSRWFCWNAQIARPKFVYCCRLANR
jgi:hypothetical protein